jgi:hypothetical protein
VQTWFRKRKGGGGGGVKTMDVERQGKRFEVALPFFVQTTTSHAS